MKAINLIITRLVLTATVFTLVLGFNACSTDSPMQQNAQQVEDTVTPFTMLKSVHPRLNKAFEDSRWMGEDGGTIILGDSLHGFSKLIIPEDALDNWERITFWWESNNFEAEFSPHGITFDQVVTMELSYEDADLTGIDENDLRIYYHDEEAGIWEVIGDQVDTTKKVVIGYTNHFSRYAIGLD